jgi:hypothetical protein
MRPPNPRHRFEAIKARTLVPETEYERSLYVILHGGQALTNVCPNRPWDNNTVIDPSVEYPYGVYLSEGIRPILEAFLMASNNDHAVSDALGMPQDEVEIYRTLFFDTAVFRTQLERMLYMQQIPEGHPNKHYYSIALRQGLEALRWNFCQEKGEVAPDTVLRTMMTDAYFRALEHRGMPSISKQAREAAKYAKISYECAKALIQKSDQLDADVENLRVKFEEVRKNRTIEDLQRDTGIEKVIH